MFSTFWKWLGQHALCGAALLTVANLVQAQGLAIPQPTIMPPMVQDAPKIQPILPVQVQEPAVPAPAAFGVPAIPANLAAPVATPNADEKFRQMEKQIQDLTSMLKAMQNQPAPVSTAAPQSGLNAQDVRTIINGYLAEQEAPRKAAEKAKANITRAYQMVSQLKTDGKLAPRYEEIYVELKKLVQPKG